MCDEIASYIELLVAMRRERAQQHYQRLTRELTQGQLLRLGHQDSLIQQASFVLLKGELYVRGETEGDRLPVSGCDFHGVQSFLAVLACRHIFRSLFLEANTPRSKQVLQFVKETVLKAISTCSK